MEILNNTEEWYEEVCIFTITNLDGYDCYDTYVNLVTDWERVDSRTYNILSMYQRQGNYILVTKPKNTDILNTVAKFADYYKKYHEKLEEERKKNEEKKRKRAEAAKAKEKQMEILKLEELKKKYNQLDKG